ncbi:hypothetical protein [Micromonospora sp. NPDC005171]|uniref:hypothetical protein n=1 Tax=Micromonospora sp. NPDC005171 TaxID=3156866 RepID=UPI0033A4BEF6
MLVLQAFHDGDQGCVARIDQRVRVLVVDVRVVATVTAGSLVPPFTVVLPWRSSGPRERIRVSLAGWCDEVEAIGDRAEEVALTFQFGRVTGPPPFEISN